MTLTQEILDRLVGFDTVSARSNLEMVDYVEAFLSARGFRVTRLADPDMPKAGLCAQIGPGGAGVLLSGHSDVVPAGQGWTRDPFRLSREGGRLYGRGTTDMKGFVAAMLSAADRAARLPLAEPLKLVLSYDEEVGCTGIARMMDRLAPLLGSPRAAIVGEPTGMQVATGHKGKRAFRAVVTGEAGHSSLAPLYANAIQVAADFVWELRSLQDDLAKTGARDDGYDIPYSTVHVGTISGGSALNIVPDRAELSLEFRHLAADDPDHLRARIDAAAARAVEAHGAPAGITIEQVAGYPGLATDETAEVVRMVEDLAGQGRTKVAYGTEAGFFAARGIPTVVCGPGSMEGQGHKADEYIGENQLAACDAMLDRLLAQMCRA